MKIEAARDQSEYCMDLCRLEIDADWALCWYRLTAKKFLAAGNFLELQSLFGEMSNEVSFS